MDVIQKVWRSDAPGVGLLRLRISAQAQHTASALGEADTVAGVTDFVLGELAPEPAIVAKPSASSGTTRYLLLGRRFVFTTHLVEARRNQYRTEPPALNVTDIWDVGPSVLSKLREIAFKPDPTYFTFEVQVKPEDRYFTEFVYWLTGNAEGWCYGHAAARAVDSILREAT